jgi:hypothetical protein
MEVLNACVNIHALEYYYRLYACEQLSKPSNVDGILFFLLNDLYHAKCGIKKTWQNDY